MIRRKYANGGVGMMLHAIVLHGIDYSIEMEVFADGVSLRWARSPR